MSTPTAARALTASMSCASNARAMRRLVPSARSTPCEPDNRLVARNLENRWEQKLRELKDAEAELAEHVVPSAEPSREQIEALANDLPALWAAPSTAHRDRKRLLRALIADITLTSQPEGRELQVGIRWRSGAASNTPSSAHPDRPTRSARHPPPSTSPGAWPPTTPTHRSPSSSTPPACAPAKVSRSTRQPSDGCAGATGSGPAPSSSSTMARSLSRASPSGSASRTASSTPGSQPASSPPAAGPPTGSTSRSRRRSSNNAAGWSLSPIHLPAETKIRAARRCSMKPPSPT